MTTCCVIGAGPSGLAAAKNLLDAGLRVTVYDRQRDVGGNWRFDDTTSHSSVFETTHIISSKTLSQYHDFPFPDGTPDYPSHAQLRAYFEAYARTFKLYEHIQFETLVLECHQRPDHTWDVTTERHGARETRHFDVLVVANGHHWKPRWPEYEGQFTGEYLHSHQYKRAEPFRGQRVLVIGGGNSACDCAVETSRVSERTEISWRRGYWIVPKFVLGKPADVLARGSAWIPPKLRYWLFEKLLVALQGRNRDIGLPDPDHHVGGTHILLNSELVYAVRHGKVKPRPDVKRFDGRTVHFADGSSAEFDTVIACTGYWISHPFLDPGLVDFSRGPVPLYLRMLPETLKHLYFIGLFQPLGCIWPSAELQAKIMARHVTGQWTPPGDLRTLVSQELERPDVQQLETPRHTITVDDVAFRERLWAQLPEASRPARV